MHSHMLTAQALMAFTVSSGAVKAEKNDQCSNIRNKFRFFLSLQDGSVTFWVIECQVYMTLLYSYL